MRESELMCKQPDGKTLWLGTADMKQSISWAGLQHEGD